MTPKQILDSFSESLIQDERILSAQEQSLIANILQHASAATGANTDMQGSVKQVVAAAIGETIAQRAFAVLGSSIVDRILEGSSLPSSDTAVRPSDIIGKHPQPPGVKAPPKQPQPPHHRPQRDTPSHPQPPHPSPLKDTPPTPSHPQPPGEPVKTPAPPSPGHPQPPGAITSTKAVSGTSVAAAERPQFLPAKCVVLDEFLAPQELTQLMRFTEEHEADFQTSSVVSPVAEKGVIDYEHRRSKVLMDVSEHEQVILNRIKAVLPRVLEELGMEEFTIANVEAQITASNDGDFFQFHSDNGSPIVAARHLTFVYFFHREPRQFEGGELRIHDARLNDETYVSEGTYQTIVPQQNQIVFFPCELMHEVTPVKCPSGLFADSRFTLNGWLRT